MGIFCGRSTWAVLILELTISLPSSGDRRAHRSFGTVWSFCNVIRKQIHSSWRSTPIPERRFGKPIAMNSLHGEHPLLLQPPMARSSSPMLQTLFEDTTLAPAKSYGG